MRHFYREAINRFQVHVVVAVVVVVLIVVFVVVVVVFVVVVVVVPLTGNHNCFAMPIFRLTMILR